MATYKEIQGEAIVNTSSDINNEGQVFYNSADKKFKLSSLAASGSFATGGNMSTARYWLRGFGTYLAGVCCSGSTSPYQQTEEYDGTSWTNGGNMGTARMRGGTGAISTQTAGLYFGGRIPPGTLFANTEEYDGSSWTDGGAMPGTRDACGGAGTQTSGLVISGRSGTFIPSSFEYDGSSWTAGGNVGTAVYNFGYAGSQTSALGFGGENAPTPIATTQAYDGSSWSSGGNLANARYSVAGAGAVNTAALAFGGASPSDDTQVDVEQYDGSSWSAQPNLPSGQSSSGAFGTTTNAVTAGGFTPPNSTLTTTFEWSGPGSQKIEDIDVT